VLEPGSVLAGKYRVERLLGRGGMGTVVAATHMQLETVFALKFIKPELAIRPGLIDRFLREAKASAQLRGEHICRVFDVSTIDGIPYLVMELLEGTDLAKLIAKEGMLTAPRACNYVLQACAGVAVAHAAGIVHRDIKPGNLFVMNGAGGVDAIKVLDFGLAKVSLGEDDEQTLVGKHLLGSPAYMAPEQIRTPHEADPRTDVWALGVVLYELITGKHPFVGKNLKELVEQIELAPAPELLGVPPELDQTVRRCLAKEPGRRFRDVGELAKAIAPLGATETRTLASVISHVLDTGRVTAPATDKPTGVATVLDSPIVNDTEPLTDPGPPAASVATTLDAATGVVATKSRWRSPRVLWLAGGAGAVTATVAIVVAVQRGQPPAASAAPPPEPVNVLPAATPPPPAPPDAAPVEVPPDAAIETAPPPKKPPKRHPTKPKDDEFRKSRI
jgi:serine/threonine protein kinase